MGFNESTTIVFLALQLTGGLGKLLLLVIALLAPSIHRSATWYSFCISWIMSCSSFCILLISGQQFTKDPSYGVCLTQAALVAAMTTFALLIEVWLKSRPGVLSERLKGFLFLVVPYVLWAMLLIFCFCVGASKPKSVLRRAEANPYCIIDYHIVPLVVYSITLVIAVTVVIILISLMLQVRRSRSNRISHRDHAGSDRTLLIRLAGFSFLALLAVFISIGYMFSAENKSSGIAYDLTFAILPPSGVLVFAMQKDVFLAGKQLFIKVFRLSREDLKPTESEDERRSSGQELIL
ncbi:hypothetical protein Moror_8708 [Moniliophthora roreri MCA 2997]|uniref:G-protein coupled receptors family 3 profile domain-containing protein n=1 Tax=Moniliophthora roreri (strain MCA 2997) TaxID=1381753 RepID=V2XAQ4_MONRO|nr:hypothetical protein Moror_8708 [Moniliophthora roreri MCA 2997]